MTGSNEPEKKINLSTQCINDYFILDQLQKQLQLFLNHALYNKTLIINSDDINKGILKILYTHPELIPQDTTINQIIINSSNIKHTKQAIRIANKIKNKSNEESFILYSSANLNQPSANLNQPSANINVKKLTNIDINNQITCSYFENFTTTTYFKNETTSEPEQGAYLNEHFDINAQNLPKFLSIPKDYVQKIKLQSLPSIYKIRIDLHTEKDLKAFLQHYLSSEDSNNKITTKKIIILPLLANSTKDEALKKLIESLNQTCSIEYQEKPFLISIENSGIIEITKDTYYKLWIKEKKTEKTGAEEKEEKERLRKEKEEQEEKEKKDKERLIKEKEEKEKKEKEKKEQEEKEKKDKERLRKEKEEKEKKDKEEKERLRKEKEEKEKKDKERLIKEKEEQEKKDKEEKERLIKEKEEQEKKDKEEKERLEKEITELTTRLNNYNQPNWKDSITAENLRFLRDELLNKKWKKDLDLYLSNRYEIHLSGKIPGLNLEENGLALLQECLLIREYPYLNKSLNTLENLITKSIPSNKPLNTLKSILENYKKTIQSPNTNLNIRKRDTLYYYYNPADYACYISATQNLLKKLNTLNELVLYDELRHKIERFQQEATSRYGSNETQDCKQKTPTAKNRKIAAINKINTNLTTYVNEKITRIKEKLQSENNTQAKTPTNDDIKLNNEKEQKVTKAANELLKTLKTQLPIINTHRDKFSWIAAMLCDIFSYLPGKFGSTLKNLFTSSKNGDKTLDNNKLLFAKTSHAAFFGIIPTNTNSFNQIHNLCTNIPSPTSTGVTKRI